MFEFKKNEIHFHLGLEKPVRIFHMTDVHLSLADERNENMIEYAAGRRNVFFKEANFPELDPVGYLREAMEYAKNYDCTVFTGDVVDFNTYKNYDVAKEILAGHDYMFAAGNHEFTPKPGIDSYILRENTKDYVQSHFRGDMFFESRIVGGVNIITADNGYTTWSEKQYEQLKAEVSRGYPIILFTHVPLHPDMLKDEWYNRDHLIGKLEGNEAEIASSLKVVKYLAEEPAFVGFCSGHWHNNAYVDFCGKPSYVVGGLFKGIVGEIIID